MKKLLITLLIIGSLLFVTSVDSIAHTTWYNQSVVDYAKTYLGTPYQFGGMDCSYFTRTVFQAYGYELYDDPNVQINEGVWVTTPQAGDLVFFDEYGYGYATHVGIALGDGNLIHASSYYGNVTISEIRYIPGYMGAKRLM